MRISKKYIGTGCNTIIYYVRVACGSYSGIKHDEWYYCSECYDKLMKHKK